MHTVKHQWKYIAPFKSNLFLDGSELLQLVDKLANSASCWREKILRKN